MESYSAKEQFWVGVACLAFALIPLWSYMTTEVMTVESLDHLTVRADYTSFQETKKSDKIIIGVDSVKYEVPYTIWKDVYETERLLDALRQSQEIELWVKGSTSRSIRVQGLRVEGVSIDPAIGVDSMNSNRLWALGLAIAFGVMGIVVLYTWSRRRRREAETDWPPGAGIE